MCASLGDQVCGPHQKVRHPPQSGWLDERGRLKGGHSGSSVVALWRAGRKAAGKALRPPPVCVVQGTTAYRRPTAPAATFALFNRDWRGCDKGFQGNGQTSSSLTSRTSGLPFVQLPVSVGGPHAAWQNKPSGSALHVHERPSSLFAFLTTAECVWLRPAK